jgi:hypothetical protein
MEDNLEGEDQLAEFLKNLQDGELEVVTLDEDNDLEQRNEGIAELMETLGKLNETKQAQYDIQVSEAKDFAQRWFGVMATVPLSYVNFPAIEKALLEENPEFLTPWFEKQVETEVLKSRLSEILEPFLDFLNTSRRAEVLSGVQHYHTLGYLEFVFDEDGSTKYVRTDKVAVLEQLKLDIEDVLKGYENFVRN